MHLPPDRPEVHLQRGHVQLSVCPTLGGAITRLRFDGVDVLRAWDGSDNVRRAGCFVLAPFSNRIGAGGFEHEGVQYGLESLSPDHPLPIHGVAWQREWRLTEQSDAELQLTLVHHPDGVHDRSWPFSFELMHRIRLAEQGIELQLSLRNTDMRSMPAGLGWHPYFARHDACTLQFAAQSVWTSDERNLPADRIQVPSRWDFTQQRLLDEPSLDHCFVGWGRQARISWPGQGIELSMTATEALGYLVVYTPPREQGFFAVEPVSHANNALGMSDPLESGVQILAPGETLQACCQINLKRRPKTDALG